MATDSVARALALSASGGGSGAVNSVNGKTGTVTLYGTDINMSTDTSLPTVTEQISSNKTNIGDLATQLGNKQDKLTAGTNITIDANNVISASGGSSSGAVRYDQAQSLSVAEENQAWTNLQLGCSKRTGVISLANWTGTSTQTITYISINADAGFEGADLTAMIKLGSSQQYSIAFNLNGTDYTISNKTPSSVASTQVRFYVSGSAGSVSYIDVMSDRVVLETTRSATYTVSGLSITTDLGSTGLYTPIDSNLIPEPETAYSGAGTGSLILKNGTANGNYAIAGGRNTQASGADSLALGYNAQTGQSYAVAIGRSTQSFGTDAVSIGYSCYTGASNSVAIGYACNTNYSGSNQVAIGYQTYGRASGAEAFGRQCIASSSEQIVFGKYNVEDTASTYSLIIGNGTGDSARRNLMTADSSNNATFYGTVSASNGALSSVSVSATGTATDEISYITVDGVEKKIAGGGSGSSNVAIIDYNDVDDTVLGAAADAGQAIYVVKDDYYWYRCTKCRVGTARRYHFVCFDVDNNQIMTMEYVGASGSWLSTGTKTFTLTPDS